MAERHPWTLLGSALACAVVLAACGGKTSDSSAEAGGSGGDPTGGNGTTSGHGGDGVGSGGGGTTSGGGGGTGGVGGAGDADVCPATCGMKSARQPFQIPSLNLAYRALAGRWEICDNLDAVFPLAPVNTIGVEFGPWPSTGSAQLFYLMRGPQGPVRVTRDQLNYEVFLPNSSSPYLISVHPPTGPNFVRTLRYSVCPTELIVGILNGEEAQLVRFP